MTEETERIAKAALKNILEYIGADMKYAEYAQLITYIEQAMKQAPEDTP